MGVTPEDRYSGCLLGLAVGDAVGTTLEFRPPGTFTPITDMIGGGPFLLKAGEWTDDTSMALCLAESLVEKGDFDPRDQMERYSQWEATGYMSSNGLYASTSGIPYNVPSVYMDFMTARWPAQPTRPVQGMAH